MTTDVSIITWNVMTIYGILDIISQAIGSAILAILSGIIFVLGHILQVFLLVTGYLLDLVFNFAYGLMSSAIVLDIGAVLGFGHFPTPDFIKTVTTGNYVHILVLITSDPTPYQATLTTSSTPVVFVPITGAFFVFIRSVILGSLVLFLLFSLVTRINAWLVNPSAGEVELFYVFPDVVFGFTAVFLLYPILVLIGMIPYIVGGAITSYFATKSITIVSPQGGIVLSTATTISGMLGGLANALSVASVKLALSHSIGVGGALAWAIAFFVLVLGVVFVFASVMFAIILAPAWVFVKRVVLSLLALLFFPLGLIVYSQSGGGGSSHPVVDSVLRRFSKGVFDVFNGFGRVVEDFIDHSIAFGFGMVILVLLLELVRNLALSVSDWANSYFNSVVGEVLNLKVGGGVKELYEGIAMMFIALVVVVIFALLLSKLKDLDQLGRGGILEFGRMEMLIGENIRRATNLVMTGLAFASLPIAGAGISAVGAGLAKLGASLAKGGALAVEAVGKKALIGKALSTTGAKLSALGVTLPAIAGSLIARKVGGEGGIGAMVSGYRRALRVFSVPEGGVREVGKEVGSSVGGGEVGSVVEGGGVEGLRPQFVAGREVVRSLGAVLLSSFAHPLAYVTDQVLRTNLSERLAEKIGTHLGRLIGNIHVSALSAQTSMKTDIGSKDLQGGKDNSRFLE